MVYRDIIFAKVKVLGSNIVIGKLKKKNQISRGGGLNERKGWKNF